MQKSGKRVRRENFAGCWVSWGWIALPALGQLGSLWPSQVRLKRVPIRQRGAEGPWPVVIRGPFLVGSARDSAGSSSLGRAHGVSSRGDLQRRGDPVPGARGRADGEEPALSSVPARASRVGTDISIYTRPRAPPMGVGGGVTGHRGRPQPGDAAPDRTLPSRRPPPAREAAHRATSLFLRSSALCRAAAGRTAYGRWRSPPGPGRGGWPAPPPGRR